MGKTTPWLANRTGNFGEAFPNVEAIDFTIDDNPWGWYNVRGHRPLHFTSASATSFIPCPNDRCRRGGFDFGTFLRNLDVNWAYSFNPLRAYPLVHAGNPRSMMCPAPPILLQRLTDGLYFDLMRADRGFGNAIGKAFERYVGTVALRIGKDTFEFREEACWGNPSVEAWTGSS